MKDSNDKLWEGLGAAARASLTKRDYGADSLPARLAHEGVDAGELISADQHDPLMKAAWIPGVELFPRKIYRQRHRGMFGEFARREEGVAARIGLWPAQWASARMFANTAKGFHVHPPSIPAGKKPADWFRQLFLDDPENHAARPYDREQWDIMFFPQGVVEMILHDTRAGLEPRTMRFFIEGDNHPGANNAGVVVPAGVAHALRAEGSEDVVMVYGTSTAFHPEFEGRIASEVETAELPESWRAFLKGNE
jgi:dTDP-4-dehydrorhamnose 3,5-epimerase-like enzyme